MRQSQNTMETRVKKLSLKDPKQKNVETIICWTILGVKVDKEAGGF